DVVGLAAQRAVQTAGLAGRGGEVDQDRAGDGQHHLHLEEQVGPRLRLLVDAADGKVGRRPGQPPDMDQDRLRTAVQAVGGHLVAVVEALQHGGGPLPPGGRDRQRVILSRPSRLNVVRWYEGAVSARYRRSWSLGTSGSRSSGDS